MNISFIILPQQFETGIFPSLELLHQANALHKANMGEDAFAIRLIGHPRKNVRISKHTVIRCDHTIAEHVDHNLIIIPGFHPAAMEGISWGKLEPVAKWLEAEHAKGAEIGSMCLGAMLLAQVGLLDGRPCTTHWTGVEMLKQNCNHAKLDPALTIAHSDRIHTSGGAFSSLQLILYFIERECGRPVATAVARMSAIEYPLRSQNHFYMFREQKGHSDATILSAQQVLEDRYPEPLLMKDLSKQLNMSERNFIRRFKKATGNSPLEYLQRIRVEVAKKKFEEGERSVSKVMYDIGYADMKSFGVLFKRLTGMTPSAYSKRYGLAA